MLIPPISGTVTHIKNERQTTAGYNVEFVLRTTEDRPQYFLLKAFSKAKVNDQFGIENFVGDFVEAEVWLNGREVRGDKGTWYSNELNLKSIKRI
jgi:hypothetical protein